MSQPPATDLHFPFNIRQGIFARNLLFLTPGAMQEDPAQSAARNRGAYLAEGLGHCSACHSPRNVLFGEKPVATTAGGVAEGWTAPALTGRSPAPLDWTQQDLVDFMRTGYSANHGVAAGPIAPVIEEGLSRLPQADLQAIAVYLRSYHPETAAGATAAALNAQAERQVEPLSSQGARLFSGACMACHAQEKGTQMAGVRPSLALNTNLFAEAPDNAIRVVLDGIQRPANAELGYMPGFRHNLDDAQIAILLNYLRQHYAGQAPWPDLAAQVGRLRAETAQK